MTTARRIADASSSRSGTTRSSTQAGNSRARMSWAAWESVPGRLPCDDHLPAKLDPRALMATSTKTQTPRVRHLWRKHERATEEALRTGLSS